MVRDGRLKVSLMLVAGLLLILLFAGLSLWLSGEQRRADAWVRHTLRVENRLNRAQVLTARAEIQRRGYLLTRDPAAIGIYRAMRREVMPQLDAVVAAVGDNAPQEARARTLRTVVVAKLDEMQRSIQLAREGRQQEAVAIVADPASRAATTQLLDLLDHMHANEQNLLVNRQLRADRLERAARTALGVSALLVLMLALLITQDRRRRLVALARANQALEEDLAQRKRLEQELERARHRAEAADEAKSSFLAHMSHEIRTPMNGVIGFTQLLLASDLAEEQRRHAELIADSGRAMMRLLNDILDLSKIEAGHLHVACEPFDLPHAIRATAKLMTPAVRQKGLQFDCTIADDVPRHVLGDGLRLRQILVNLIANATKFTSDGSITVHAAVERDVVAIAVVDTGIGIAPERQAAIFEQFVQADDDITPRYGGTGLGLAISVQLAELMGGSLSVDSEPGHGSRFILSIPVRLPAERIEEPAAPVSETPVARLDRAAHILVAEDHDINQMLIGELLERRGHRFDIAADGAEAVAAVERAFRSGRPYDLVLMDMQMPQMDGIEAARRIRAAGIGAERLPIVALTANAYADDVAVCLRAGMQAHLAKPLNEAELDQAIARWAQREAASPPDKAARFSPQLRERYAARRAELLAHIDALAARDDLSETEAQRLGQMLHKFLGSAEMFGDERLAEAARALEASLEEQGRPPIEILRTAAETIRKAA